MGCTASQVDEPLPSEEHTHGQNRTDDFSNPATVTRIPRHHIFRIKRKEGESESAFQRRSEREEQTHIRQQLEQLHLLIDDDELDGIENQIVVWQGQYSRVYTSEWRSVSVCIKQLNEYSKEFQDSSDGAKKTTSQNRRALDLHFAREMMDVSVLHHPGIIEILGCSLEHGVTITPIMTRGTLQNVLLGQAPTIHQNNASKHPIEKQKLLWATKYKFISQIAGALNFMHNLDPPMPHGDLRASHILVATDWTLRIAGFATPLRLACQTRPEEGATSLNLRHISHLAPEVMQGASRPDTMEADIYSFGVLTWFILTQEEPYAGWRKSEIATHVLSEHSHLDTDRDFGEDVPSSISELLLGCFEIDPRDRWTIRDIRQFLQRIPH